MHGLNILALAGLALVATPAAAATRTYIVTDFDELRLAGPIDLVVETGRGVSARGEGDADMLDQIDLAVSARTLTVRVRPSPFSTRRDTISGPVKLMLTVPALRRIEMGGAGSVRANGLDKLKADIVAAGSGSITVSGIDTDALGVVQSGSGSIDLSGKARSAAIRVSGSGRVAAAGLAANDLDLTMDGAANVEATAARSAKVVAAGPGTVTVEGKPACTVRHSGSGTVRCGGERF